MTVEKSLEAARHQAARFLVEDAGPTSVEYAVMLALIIGVAITGVTLLGNKVNLVFTNLDTRLTQAGEGIFTPAT